MKHIATYILIAFSLAATSSELFGQQGFARNTRKNSYINLGIMPGLPEYFGDLAPQSLWGSARSNFLESGQTQLNIPAVTIFGTWKRGPNLHQRFSLSWARLQAQDYFAGKGTVPETTAELITPEFEQFRNFDLFRYVRNLHFRNDIFEFSHILEWKLKGHEKEVFFRRFPGFNPYVFLGISVLYSNPKARAPEGDWGTYQGGDWVPLRKFQTEGQSDPYSPIQFAIPFGIGVKKKINNWWDVHFEIGYRAALTDYLDDVSTSYADLGFWQYSGEFQGGPSSNDPEINALLAQALSDRSLEGTNGTNVGNLRGGINYVGGFDAEPRETFLVEALNPLSYTSIYQDENGNSPRYNVINGFGNTQDGFLPTRRGDVGDNDAYIFLSVGVSYILDRGVKTPRYQGALRAHDWNHRIKRKRALRAKTRDRTKYITGNKKEQKKIRKTRKKLEKNPWRGRK